VLNNGCVRQVEGTSVPRLPKAGLPLKITNRKADAQEIPDSLPHQRQSVNRLQDLRECFVGKPGRPSVLQAPAALVLYHSTVRRNPSRKSTIGW
jgi:hypothetical protein